MMLAALRSFMLSLALLSSVGARADATDTLRQFLRDTPSGKGSFVQVVTAPDGVRQKRSEGSFEFLRPNRFRFQYVKPYEQLIVSDGSRIWIYDADLQQASVRKWDAMLDGTPAALLAGGSLDKDFVLQTQRSQDGLDWVLAQPRTKDGSIRQMRIGFRGKEPAVIEVTDNLGQRTALQLGTLDTATPIAADRFVFKAPAGVDVVQQ
jgi:outer membrane lipoprotein carrier protein